MSSQPDKSHTDPETTFRPHTYDGIQEYDQRLPNWWLWTFYVAIIFSVYYWMSWYQSEVEMSDADRVQNALDEIADTKLAMSIGTLDNEKLWAFSRNEEFVAAGEHTFMANCISCHGQDLQGGIGPNLTDDEWIHGGEPMNVINTVTNGVLDKGMQAWGGILGDKGVAEVVAFVLSHHEPPESSADDNGTEETSGESL